jgi:hypothetical protein
VKRVYKTCVDIGTETEINVTVTYEAHKGERRTPDYPGSPPYLEISRIVRDDNREPVNLPDSTLDKLEIAILESYAENYWG